MAFMNELAKLLREKHQAAGAAYAKWARQQARQDAGSLIDTLNTLSTFHSRVMDLCILDPANSPTLFRKSGPTYVMNDWIKDLYRKIYTAACTSRSKQSGSVSKLPTFVLEGVEYVFPATLDGCLQPFKAVERPQQTVPQEAVEEDLDELLRQIEGPTASKKKGKKKSKDTQAASPSSAAAAIEDKPTRDEEDDQASAASSEPICAIPPSTMPITVLPARQIKYTKTIRSWFVKPEVVLEDYGYLDGGESHRGEIFNELLDKCGGDEECAKQKIIDHHTVPFVIDPYMFNFDPITVNGEELLLQAPLIYQKRDGQNTKMASMNCYLENNQKLKKGNLPSILFFIASSNQ